MHRSRFSDIQDPLDPAWHGHASIERERRIAGVSIVAAAALLVAVAIGLGWVVTDPDAGSTSTSVAARGGPPRGAASAARPPGTAVRVTGGANDLPGIQQWQQAPSAPSVRAVKRAAAKAVTGSGWAPAAATVPIYASGSGLLEGDLAGIDPRLLRRLDQVAVGLGRKVEVISGWRSHHEQGELYQRFLAGTGNLAAVPGTSAHETGIAADVYVDGVALASVPAAAGLASAAGLHFPVGGEAWHVEMVGGASAT